MSFICLVRRPLASKYSFSPLKHKKCLKNINNNDIVIIKTLTKQTDTVKENLWGNYEFFTY